MNPIPPPPRMRGSKVAPGAPSTEALPHGMSNGTNTVGVKRFPRPPPGPSGQVPQPGKVPRETRFGDIRKLANLHLARRQQRPPLPPRGVEPPASQKLGSQPTGSRQGVSGLTRPGPSVPFTSSISNTQHIAQPISVPSSVPQNTKPLTFVPPPPKSKPPPSGRTSLTKHTTTGTNRPSVPSTDPTAASVAAATLLENPQHIVNSDSNSATAPTKSDRSSAIGLKIVVEDGVESETAPTPMAQQSPQRVRVTREVQEDSQFTGFDSIPVEDDQPAQATAGNPESMQNGPSSMQHDLLMLSTLGQGASGIVYRALHIPTMRMVAVKSIPVYDANKRATMVKELSALYANLVSLETEVVVDVTKAIPDLDESVESITESDGHIQQRPQRISATPQPPCPYVVAFYDAFINAELGNLSMVVEYMDGGSLQDIIDTGGCANESILSQVSFRILKGLQFIHSKHQIHRDIKPANLLINQRGEVKVSDFGIVKDLESTQAMANTFVGTLTYMSPERISGKSYGPNSDVWSLGLSIMTCALGEFPLTTSGGYWGIMHSLNEEPVPELPSDEFSPECCDFVAKCLSKDPRDRPSVESLLQHPFLADCEQAILEQQREDFESHLINESVELNNDEIMAYEPEEGAWIGTDNGRAELDNICDMVMKHHCSNILNNALPGEPLSTYADSIPTIGVKQAHSLARQLEVPNWLVRKRMLDARGVYSELLRNGVGEEESA